MKFDKVDIFEEMYADKRINKKDAIKLCCITFYCNTAPNCANPWSWDLYFKEVGYCWVTICQSSKNKKRPYKVQDGATYGMYDIYDNKRARSYMNYEDAFEEYERRINDILDIYA